MNKSRAIILLKLFCSVVEQIRKNYEVFNTVNAETSKRIAKI